MITDRPVRIRDKKITGRPSIHGLSDFSDLDKSIMTKKQSRSLSPKKNISNMEQSNKNKENQQTKKHGLERNDNRDAVDEQDFRKDMLNSSGADDYSDESESFDDDEGDQRSPHTPENSPKVLKSSVKSSTTAKTYKPLRKELHSFRDNTASQDKPEASYLPWILMGLFVLFLSFTCYGLLTNDSDDSSENEEFNITTQIKSLSKSFPSQMDSTWLHLEVGINDVKEYSKPSVFMFVHSGAERAAFEIAKKSARIASKYLSRNPNQEGKGPLILMSQDLKFTDHGELISRYKKELQTRHSMLVTDLESVSGNVAQGFRYFCDEYNPLVANAAIFFTVNMKNCKGVDLSEFYEGTELTAIVLTEKCLMNNWSDDLEPNIWQPLLARVVGIVLKIVPEN